MSLDKAANATGWGLWAAGTALSDRITAVAMALVGAGILIGNMSLKVYRDYLATRREDERERVLLSLERDRKIQELLVEVAKLKHELERARCPYAVDGQAKCQPDATGIEADSAGGETP